MSEKLQRTSIALKPAIKENIEILAHIRQKTFNATVNEILQAHIDSNRDTLDEYKQFLSKLNKQ